MRYSVLLQLHMETIGTQTCLGILFLLLCLPYLSITNEIYHPDDLFSINCGSSNNNSFDGRDWTGDNTSKLLLESHDEPSSSASALTPSTIQGPYTSARLSYSQFTYSFPVTPGQKFLRLFFNPTSYPNFDPNKAYFSVKSGEYTLLKDFNATLYAEAEDNPQGTFFREYCINVEAGQRLNITFIPSTPYYAFINGIEIVSMPTYLYYTNPDKLELMLIGTTVQYRIENNSALETKYNLNVGVKTLSPLEDTGMLRSWEGDDDKYVDSPSLTGGDYAGKTKLRFTLIPEYTAPEGIYRTIRNMGWNATLNMNSNLTWELPVDSGFTYMLRLHFCELDPRVHSIGDRRFFIFIQDQMVDDNADVLVWTNEQKGVPVVKDYVVRIQGNQKNTNLSIKLHPQPTSPYPDAYLNGIQLFKINDSQGNLAGPNPDPIPQTQFTHQTSEKKKTTNKLATVTGAVSGVVLLFIVVVIVVFFLIKRGKINDKGSSKHKDKTSRGGGSSSLPSNLCRHFSIEEIRTATNNFDKLFVVGVGGFGNVYKGYIDDGATRVAIKRLKPGSQQGAHEFLNEIEMLSKLRHLHLVSLIGYCCENNEMILVYDFMPRGTLRDHLYNTESENPPLSWKQRLHVCIGAARGLHYLHTGAKHMIIHRDVKSTNILLDEKWVAKVADFGLSRVGPMGECMTHVSTVVKGSVGYLDPEYYKRQRLTEKSDVYSFGVVLLEVLCGRQPLLRTVEKRQVSLVDWARKCYEMGTLGEIVDPVLKGQIAPQCFSKFGEIAVSCLLDDGAQRPSMNDVVWGLEFVLQLQENAVGVGVGVGGVVVEGERNDEDSDHDMFSSSTSSRHVSDNSKSSGVSMTSSGDHSYGMSKESQRLLSENVFSEIGNPKGR